ncbi:MAG: hypothetical protein FWB83_00930 [Treponema sp.]|nr:hypothetical protein [Treponema sp.]
MGILDEQSIDTDRLIADINGATERNLLLIEDSIMKLKACAEEAEAKISSYKKELEQMQDSITASPPETLYTSLGKGIRAAFEPDEGAYRDVHLDTIRISGLPAAVKPAAKPPAVKQEQLFDIEEPPKNPSNRRIRAQIDQLANEGASTEEIASRLGISIAEVDLAMNLRRRK